MEAFLAIGTVILVITSIKIKDYRQSKQHPPRKWEGKSKEELDQELQHAENKAEAQKGIGRTGGGP